ncbi:hypothetical protein AKO1_001509, partial [Acrasis kona]
KTRLQLASANLLLDLLKGFLHGFQEARGVQDLTQCMEIVNGVTISEVCKAFSYSSENRNVIQHGDSGIDDVDYAINILYNDKDASDDEMKNVEDLYKFLPSLPVYNKYENEMRCVSTFYKEAEVCVERGHDEWFSSYVKRCTISRLGNI